jgi:hypothetical protein
MNTQNTISNKFDLKWSTSFSYTKKPQERNDNLKLFLSNALFGGEVGAPFKFSPLGLALWPYLQTSYFVGKGLPGTNNQAYLASSYVTI